MALVHRRNIARLLMGRMSRVFAELNERQDRIAVHFPYDPGAVEAVKEIPGRRFVGREKSETGRPYWTIPLDLAAARRLREAFGSDLELGQGVRAWGRDQVAKERNLGTLTTANDADLSRVPVEAPRIAQAIAGEPVEGLDLPPIPTGEPHPLMTTRDPRPYQRADIAMMAETNSINANQPGTGKTLEVLGAIVEAGLLEGAHLVSAPVRSAENVWAKEINTFLPGSQVFASEDPAHRPAAIAAGLDAIANGNESGNRSVFVVINPDLLRLVKLDEKDETSEVAKRDYKGNRYGFRSELQKRLLATEWASVTIDEFHKTGLNTALSMFRLGVSLLKGERFWALSGTPMGGKPIRLFPVLQWIEPNRFTSKWRWAEMYLTIEEKDAGSKGMKKEIKGLAPGREADFERDHRTLLVRRLKRDALPGLPPKVEIVVECPMTPAQRKQYKRFAEDAEVKIEGGTVRGRGVLSEYGRAKQFANAACEIIDGEVRPTEDSGKLPLLMERLDENGVRTKDAEPGARAIVASESKRMVEMVVGFLRSAGLDADALTGDTKDSKPILDRFTGGDSRPYVLVMTTQTGGVSLNLEAAGSVHALDETWDPDDMEQLFDRGDRGSRTTPLRCYVYRTKGTIQEYVAEVAEGKKVTNKTVLDLRRRGLRA